ncbi:hypothetical protein E2986_12659 [Frieseomelitta varia]|uniref:Uncharacterized protein n=1 Tax=Frieseomelitta varia TaxID=561572 RepID=A0A833RDG9_9HYME|nr:hypothetical protein E2986_12659 [Frieseomelitta varia]
MPPPPPVPPKPNTEQSKTQDIQASNIGGEKKRSKLNTVDTSFSGDLIGTVFSGRNQLLRFLCTHVSIDTTHFGKKVVLEDRSIWRLSQGYGYDDQSRSIALFDHATPRWDVNDRFVVRLCDDTRLQIIYPPVWSTRTRPAISNLA